MEIKVYKSPESYDSDDIRWIKDGVEAGYGYKGKKDMLLCVTRCPMCEKENYAMAVSSGFCAWCAFDANAPQKPIK